MRWNQDDFYLMHFFYNPIFDTISKTKIEGVGSVGERIKSNRFNQNIWGKNTIWSSFFFDSWKQGKPVY